MNPHRSPPRPPTVFPPAPLWKRVWFVLSGGRRRIALKRARAAAAVELWRGYLRRCDDYVDELARWREARLVRGRPPPPPLPPPPPPERVTE